MFRKEFQLFVWFCISMCMVSSCKTIDIISYKEQAQVKITKKWKNYEARRYKKAPKYTQNCLISVCYPQLQGLSNLSMQDSLNHQLKSHFLTKYFKGCQQYNFIRTPMFNKMPRGNWGEDSADSLNISKNKINYKVYFKSSKILSLLMMRQSQLFPGGSRSTYYDQKALNIDLNTGQFLDWQQVFNQRKSKEIELIFLKYLKGIKLFEDHYKEWGQVPVSKIHFVMTKK